ncbi:MAG: outer membrane lipoprotein carrier protein LolA [Fibrobacteraceae bacterium]|nr:outer membrane lipoprotein carrier protein LolA [Fibrobacteraceae bacterium]
MRNIVFVLMVLAVYAIAGSVPAEAEQVLKKFAESAVVQGNFKQIKYIKKISRSFEAEGTFLIAKDYGVVWNTEKPFKSTMIITQTQMIQKSASGMVSKMDASENAVFGEFSKTIQSIFSGDLKSIEEHFTLNPPKSSNTKGITLAPKEKAVRQVIDNIQLNITGNELKNIIMTDSDGNLLTYEFSNQETYKTITEVQKQLFQ